MPYVREGKCVYKQNADGSRGALRGCSESEEEAKAYMRALYAHEKEVQMISPRQFAKLYNLKEKDFAYAASESWVVDSVNQAISALLSIARQETYQGEKDDAREIVTMLKALMQFGSDQLDEMDNALQDGTGDMLSGLYKESSGEKKGTDSHSDYLVTDSDGNGHLPVGKNGKLDHRLMAAAKAALTSNYRGHSYQGDDKAKATSKLKALYKSEGLNWDEKESTLVSERMLIYKDTKTDHYRWVLYTSSSFKDRDKDILAQAALEKDCDEMNLTGEYGELNWYHCNGLLHEGEKEVRPYLPLGTCDTSFMVGKVNLESGLFNSDVIGEKMMAHADELAASKEFYYADPVYDKSLDANVYSYIHTAGRSLLPRGKESNLLTRLFVWNKKEKDMAGTDRIAKFKELLGDEELAEKYLTNAATLQKKAEELQLKSKEMTDAEDETDNGADEATEDKNGKKKKTVAKETDESLVLQEALAPFATAMEKMTQSLDAMNKLNEKQAKRIETLEKQQRVLLGVDGKGVRNSESPNTVVNENQLSEKEIEFNKAKETFEKLAAEVAREKQGQIDTTTPEGHFQSFISTFAQPPLNPMQQ